MNIIERLRLTNHLKRKVLIVAFFSILSMTVLEIWSVNRLSTYGEQISSLEQTRLALEMENQLLENKIASQGSLADIEAKSHALGFAKMKKPEYLEDHNLALNHAP